ncbi:MAG: pyruvate kinase [Planctomycetota bacterium]
MPADPDASSPPNADRGGASVASLVLTKIVATLGPASDNVDTLADMIRGGVRVVRLNFSHGTLDDAARRLDTIRQAVERAGLGVGVLGDLSGPKIRATSNFPDGPIELATGDQVVISADDAPAVRHPDGHVSLGTTYPQMVQEVGEGHRVLINDGAIRMLAIDHAPANQAEGLPDRLICNVTHGDTLSAKKGINLPDSTISAPSLTDWDRRCAAWAVEHELDFLALSFVRKAADIEELIDLLATLGRNNRGIRTQTRLPIVAKIETPQALHQLPEILQVVDAIMVARGDLGVEMDVAEVPVIQKRLVREAHAVGRPVIVATQMLESMIEAPSPTRAEVSDVANAILDGADATMLSGETAVGQFPKLCVETMARTARLAEQHLAEHGIAPSQRPAARDPRTGVGTGVGGKHRLSALARGVAAVVEELDPKYVVVWSQLGGSARYLAQARFRRPILAFSTDHLAVRRMALLYGVHPMHMDMPDDPERFLLNVEQIILERHWAEVGDAIVVVKGAPLGSPGVTNKIRIHYLGDVCALPGG